MMMSRISPSCSLCRRQLQRFLPLSSSSVSSSRTLSTPTNNNNNNNSNTDNPPKNNVDFRPRRIILIRHGQSEGNVDERAYVTTADWRIPLTEVGRNQAKGELKLVRKLCYVA
mmetsp:Transcript_10816/g.20018  ORF Transcript_10816/g.20018 Transcript_10816/m.20018 type:complete len:113 (+) Transcript_10816:201-539(+)